MNRNQDYKVRPRVIHINDAPKYWKEDPHYVYIGRSGKGMDGYFGNPIKREPNQKRGSTLKKYKEYLDHRCRTDEEFCRRVISLQNKTLVCFCKPLKCHGDILADYVEFLWSNRGGRSV